DREEQVWRVLARMDVQDRRVLPALLLAVVHDVERVTLAIELMIIDGGGDAGGNGKEAGMAEGEPERSLTTHANAQEADRALRDAPALGEIRDDMIDQMPLGGPLGIELGE